MESHGWASKEAHDRRRFHHWGKPAQMEDNEQWRVSGQERGEKQRHWMISRDR